MPSKLAIVKLSIPLLTAIVLVPLFGCRTNAPLRPYQSRFAVSMPALESLSADYSLVPIPLDSLARIILSDELVEIHRPDLFGTPMVALYQNPLIPSNSLRLPVYRVVGEVERISYEPVQDVEGRIAAYALAGLVGLALTSDEGAMAVCAQYRFTLKDEHNRSVDSFLVIGVASGLPSEKSRRRLTIEANYFAASELATELVLRISKLNGINLDHSKPVFCDFEKRIARYYKYFEAKLGRTSR